MSVIQAFTHADDSIRSNSRLRLLWHTDRRGQPGIEPPTLQLVDDLLYLLCHRRGVSGKHEYLEACSLIKNIHITPVSLCLFHPQELNILDNKTLLHQSLFKMKLMLVTASLCIAHLGPAFSLSSGGNVVCIK